MALAALAFSAMNACAKWAGQRLDPAELQERFDRGGKRGGLLGATNKMKYWDLYAELYHTLKQNPQDDFPHTFVEEFARAYEEKLSGLAHRRSRAATDGEPSETPRQRPPAANNR